VPATRGSNQGQCIKFVTHQGKTGKSKDKDKDQRGKKKGGKKK
jgi:hypothetical protein